MSVLELTHRGCQDQGVTTGGSGPGWESSTKPRQKGLFVFFHNKNNRSRNFVCTTLLLPHPIPSGSKVLSGEPHCPGDTKQPCWTPKGQQRGLWGCWGCQGQRPAPFMLTHSDTASAASLSRSVPQLVRLQPQR